MVASRRDRGSPQGSVCRHQIAIARRPQPLIRCRDGRRRRIKAGSGGDHRHCIGGELDAAAHPGRDQDRPSAGQRAMRIGLGLRRGLARIDIAGIPAQGDPIRRRGLHPGRPSAQPAPGRAGCEQKRRARRKYGLASITSRMGQIHTRPANAGCRPPLSRRMVAALGSRRPARHSRGDRHRSRQHGGRSDPGAFRDRDARHRISCATATRRCWRASIGRKARGRFRR